MIQGKKITNKALTCVQDRFKYCYTNLVYLNNKNTLVLINLNAVSMIHRSKI